MDVIFKYELSDTIKMPIKSVIVTDNNLYLVSGLSNESKYDIDSSKIKSTIEKYADKINNIKNKELPSLPILDGYNNSIEFKYNNKKYNYEFRNLDFYSKEEIDENEYLSLVFEFLIEIDDELESQVKEVEKYFVLDDE